MELLDKVAAFGFGAQALFSFLLAMLVLTTKDSSVAKRFLLLSLAEMLLVIRGDWLKMPASLLLRHTLSKMIRGFKAKFA